MSSSYRHDFFLSHSTRANPNVDGENRVNKVCFALRSRGFRVALDRDSFECGELVLSAIANELYASRFSVVFYDSWAQASGWVGAELTIMRERRHTNEMKSCIVLLEEDIVPPPGFSDADVLHYVREEPVPALVERIIAHVGA